MTNKETFTRLRAIFGFEKDKDYLAWVKSIIPHYDCHHILGSFLGKKMTDYLVIPLSHKEHLEQAENHKADYCIKHFNSSVELLKRYAKQKYGLGVGVIPIEAETGLYEPHKVNELIKLIAEMKCQK